MNQGRVGTILTTAALAVPFGNVALAQEESDRKIEEVIVTAERREASIQDTSISITAFTDQFLDDFGIRNQEDLQNFVPATTIQPYDASIRGVGRNFRSLGGDPGVSTYMNGIYSEDLVTATAATFWDVERIEVLRGPQGTLYGRNAVGGAINILYKEPTPELDTAFRAIVGDFGAAEGYGAVSGPLLGDQLMGRVNFAIRNRNGTVEDIGDPDGDGLDSLGTTNYAILLKWLPADSLEFNIRYNKMSIDRVFGGADGGGLVVLNEEGKQTRVTDALVPGYRRIDMEKTNIANWTDIDYYDQNQEIIYFTNPETGERVATQRNRAGVDLGAFDGFQNAAASLDGFNHTSPESAARYNACVFPDDIKGADVCAATNGENLEDIGQEGIQFNVSWDATDSITLKYLYGKNSLLYQRVTDDDNTASLVHDRHFYVNHEASYESHELQAFYDIGDRVTFTSGIFFYNATIDQRGDFYSAVPEQRFSQPYVDNTSLPPSGASITQVLTAVGVFSPDVIHLHSARDACLENPDSRPSCTRNFASDNTAENLVIAGIPGGNNNLIISPWRGDDGTDRRLDVFRGPNTKGSDLLYHTQTMREAFAAYTQGVFDLSDVFTLTLGIRYARDELVSEENLFRYTESTLGGTTGVLTDVNIPVWFINLVNGGITPNGDGTYSPVQYKHVQGGFPIAVSVYRPFERSDEDITYRVNLDWDITDAAMMYFSVTTGYRAGGYNLVFFSNSPTYEPEQLTSYEIGYKTQWMNDRLQVNGSFYLYDYSNIHTVALEITSLGGATVSTLAAPGATINGIEAEVTWLATDRITLGGNFSFTPNKYSEDLHIKDWSGLDAPGSIFPSQAEQVVNINGNRLLHVPDAKYTAWGSYGFGMENGSTIEFFGAYSWISDVYYSSFESEDDKSQAYGRIDLRATYVSGGGNWVVSGFVNNVLDTVGVLQVQSTGEAEFFRHTAGTTVPRHMGVEITYQLGN